MNKKNIEDIYPLSPSQQGILLQTVVDPDSGIHVEQLVCGLEGALDREAFEHAWHSVVGRHPVLRTGFAWKNLEEPLQVVLREVDVTIAWEDWQDLLPEELDHVLQDYLLEERERGFDLTKPPLMRMALCQTAPERYQFIWTHHHILMDGWCGPVLIREFLAYYESYRAGRDLELPKARPYKEYIHWLKGRETAEAEGFWREKLGGFDRPTPLGFQTEVDFVTAAETRYGEHRATVPEETAERLESLAKRYQLSLSTLIQGIWAVLLMRYSGSDDVVFGTTVSGRPPDLSGIESTIGLFINTLPVRARRSVPYQPFWTWLKSIQEYSFQIQAYAHTPGPLVHQWSDLPGSQPLFESLLVVENYPLELPDLDAFSLKIDLKEARSEGARTGYPLTILVIESEELLFQLVYDARRFQHAESAKILEGFTALLSEIAKGGDPALDELLESIPGNLIPRVRLPQDKGRTGEKAGFVEPRTETEARLAGLWAEILGVDRVGVCDNFFELGGHSLLAIELYYQVREAYPVELPLLSLLEEPTIERLAKAIEGAGSEAQAGMTGLARTADLNAEAVLDPEIAPHDLHFEFTDAPENIFLTGATGFLGAFLLNELLERTRAKIHCLVRAADPVQGKERLRNNLEAYSLWQDDYADRILPVIGDLSKPRFGLNPAAFHQLASRVESIYHNGAWVSYLFPYAALKRANVLGTQEALRLSCQARLKPVHYISSLAVFPLPLDGEKLVVREEDGIDHGAYLFGGYAQSKWVAEQLVWEAGARGVPVCVYRPGLITGESRSGICNLGDMMSLLVKGSIQLGSSPVIDTMVDMTPVDYVSRAIVAISLQVSALGRAFHLANPQPAGWQEILNWIRSYGYPLENVSYEDWQDQLDNLDKERSGNALYPLLPLLTAGMEGEKNSKPLLARASMPIYDCRETQTMLAETGIECPPVSRDLLRIYLAYFIETGFLGAPDRESLEDTLPVAASD